MKCPYCSHLGDKVVDVTRGSAESPPLAPDDTIATVPPVELNELMEESRRIVRQVDRASSDLAKLMDAIASPETVMSELSRISTIPLCPAGAFSPVPSSTAPGAPWIVTCARPSRTRRLRAYVPRASRTVPP